MNKLLPLLAFSVLLLVPVGAQNVFGHGNVDQDNLVGSSVGLNVFLSQPMGQQFVPAQSQLVAVDLELQQIFSLQPTVTVTIHQNDITGPILGTTSLLVDFSAGNGIYHFDFASPIPVTPGVVHVIQVQSDVEVFLGADGDTYASGTSIVSGLSGGGDFIFATYYPEQVVAGKIIPIESTSLLLAGLQTSAIWLAPVVISAVGIGLVLVRRK